MFIMTFMTYCEQDSNTFKNGSPGVHVHIPPLIKMIYVYNKYY